MNKKRFLAVDQGNSFVKLTLFVGEEKREMCRLHADAVEELFSLVDSWNPDCGAFCSVGKIDSRMVESLRLALEGRFMILSRSTKLPFSVNYDTPSSLGLDRIALAAGAVSLYPGECVAVVDAGTAVTLDLVDDTPSFLGGRIAPGIRLRLESLHNHTAALPMVSAEGETPVIGHSTETSIRSGVVRGLADEIKGTFNQYKEAFGCRRLVLTGGDAALLIECIKPCIHVDHVTDLMARGLLYIYNYNEIYN